VTTRFFSSFQAAITDTDRGEALRVVQSAVEAGIPAEKVLFELVLPALDRMVRSVSEGCGASLAQHFMTSQIASELAAWLIPRFQNQRGPAGRVVIGTSVGDFHALGKTIVSGCLRAHNYIVIDLGLNVAPEAFVDTALAEEASVIGISSMMVHTAVGGLGCRKVREILRARALEDRIKVIVGGAPYRHDPALYRAVQADAWAEDGLTAAGVIHALIKEAAR
jgi:trimethylamine corrinoid protein